VLTDLDPLGATKRLLSRVGFVLVPLSVLYCKYYPSIGRLMTRSWMNTYVGVTTQKNTLGWLCLLLGLGFLWRIRALYRDRENPTRKRRILAHAILLGMVLWLLQMSDSMTSFASLVMAGTAMVGFDVNEAHNGYLGIFLNLGWIGVGLLTIVFVTGYQKVIAALRRNTETGNLNLAWFLAVPISSLTEAGFRMLSLTWIFFL